MKTRAVILAGGEGSRLSVLTAKRTKPAVPFAGKYRIIDFTLSNCVNSGIFDVMLLAQYRPQSLIEHIGAGGPWDLDRDFTGGLRILTPYKARNDTDWFVGTADAVQQNFSFIKQGRPDLVLILSGDHIYSMDYDTLVTFHLDNRADITMGTIRVPINEASRYGIVERNNDYQVTSFVEKPDKPESDLANMGVYLFNIDVLDTILWEDRMNRESSHDFGKDILPRLLTLGRRVLAYPYTGYWVDVGTTQSYWQAHMDMLRSVPALDLNNRSWIIHTRTEERPPARLQKGAIVSDSMVSDGCVIESGARVEGSVLSPGVRVKSGAYVWKSIILTDGEIGSEAHIGRAILDKQIRVGEKARVGTIDEDESADLALVGKNSLVPADYVVEPGGVVSTDVIPIDYPSPIVKSGELIQTKRLPYEI